MSIRLKVIFFFLNAVTILNLPAQIASVFDNFSFGDPVNSVQREIRKISDSIKLIEIHNPTFPLSKNTETHVLAYTLRIKGKTLEKAVFIFSDDRLCYIEAKGNVVKVFGTNRNDEPRKFMDYQVFVSDLLFLHHKEDTAWILTPEAAHLNVFTWHNPLLIASNNLMNYNASAKIPEFIKMGGSLKTELAKFKKASRIVQVDELDGSDPNAQIQINAYGIEYAGFPRKFEARFGDDILTMIWVLTSKGEEDRIREKLIKAYGKPIFINDTWEFFNHWTVALRKDKPEVLFLTKELGTQYKKRLNK